MTIRRLRSGSGGLRPLLCGLCGLVLLLLPAIARAQMPDLRSMSGQPLPSGDLAPGSVSVRLVRQAIGNNVADHTVDVRISAGSIVKSGKTDAAGRVVFTGLAPGATYRAVSEVDGETLESQPFEMPANGGIRILLAAGLGAASGSGAPAAAAPTASPGQGPAPPSAPATPEAPATPAAPGTITLGGQSRVVFELADESVEVFVLMDLVNGGKTPASLPQPIVFQLPDGVLGGAVLEESASVGKLEGRRVVVAGPLAPGTTTLQFAYRVPSDTGRIAVRQLLPLPAPQGTVIVRKSGDVAVTLAGEQGRREIPLEGRTYYLLTTGPIPAGRPVDVTVTGLPARARWPTYVALTLAGLILVTGAWWAVGPGETPQQTRERLRRERAARFDELVKVERKLRGKSGGDEELLARRDVLFDEIAQFDTLLDGPAHPGAPPDRERVRREQASTVH